MSTANDPAGATPGEGAHAELEALYDGLFRGPRERFVAERNAAAQQLKARGWAEAAARVKALTKPSVSVWAVNQLWWTARGEVEALYDASRHLAEAIGVGAGPAGHAAAGQARRRALETLVAAASEVLAQAGHATGMATARRISATLDAAAAHAALGSVDVPPIGRLTEDLDPPALERVIGLGAGLGVSEPARPLPSPEPAAVAGPGQGDAEAAVAEAERQRNAAKARVGEAARALDEAARAADEAVLEAQRTGEASREARARADAARQLADDAERVALRAQAEARREHERVDAAKEELESRAAELDRRAEALVKARQRLAVLGPRRG